MNVFSIIAKIFTHVQTALFLKGKETDWTDSLVSLSSDSV